MHHSWLCSLPTGGHPTRIICTSICKIHCHAQSRSAPQWQTQAVAACVAAILCLSQYWLGVIWQCLPKQISTTSSVTALCIEATQADAMSASSTFSVDASETVCNTSTCTCTWTDPKRVCLRSVQQELMHFQGGKPSPRCIGALFPRPREMSCRQLQLQQASLCR